jgi:hypothetical protein
MRLFLASSNPDLASAFGECKMAVCGAIEGLLQKTGLQPKDVVGLVYLLGGSGKCTTVFYGSSMGSLPKRRTIATQLPTTFAQVQCFRVSRQNCHVISDLVATRTHFLLKQDILVTTCSIYCPTPSMASMVVNHFKMKSDIQVTMTD